MNISFVACGLSPIKIHFSDYTKSLISRIIECYVFFNKISLKLHLYSVTVYFAAITLVIVLAWLL